MTLQTPDSGGFSPRQRAMLPLAMPEPSTVPAVADWQIGRMPECQTCLCRHREAEGRERKTSGISSRVEREKGASRRVGEQARSNVTKVPQAPSSQHLSKLQRRLMSSTIVGRYRQMSLSSTGANGRLPALIGSLGDDGTGIHSR